MSAHRILVLNKPFNVLSQFTDASGRPTLADYVPVKGVYVAGRLDRDSEGVLVLTNDGAMQHRIAHPSNKMSKTYWAQVEGEASDERLAELQSGVLLKDGPAVAVRARQMSEPHQIWPRQPPIRVRRSIPDSWVEITLTEGRNRQVRRMLAAVGYPVLRLVRYRVGSWTVDGLAPGEWREV